MTTPMSSPAGPASYQLTNEVFQTALNGSGNGTIQFSPGQPPKAGCGVGASRKGGLTWDVTSITVTANPASGNTQVKLACAVVVYLAWGILPASPGPNDLVGNTLLLPTNAGPSSANCLVPVTVQPGDWFIVTFASGDPAAVVSARVYGTVNPPGSK